jgi:hypothetical protein
MKKTILFLTTFLLIHVASCTNSEDTLEAEANDIEVRCGFHNGHQLWKGPRGGCYYYNDNNNKIYVERSECNC